VSQHLNLVEGETEMRCRQLAQQLDINRIGDRITLYGVGGAARLPSFILLVDNSISRALAKLARAVSRQWNHSWVRPSGRERSTKAREYQRRGRFGADTGGTQVAPEHG
jgi:hypothetical protein